MKKSDFIVKMLELGSQLEKADKGIYYTIDIWQNTK